MLRLLLRFLLLVVLDERFFEVVLFFTIGFL